MKGSVQFRDRERGATRKTGAVCAASGAVSVLRLSKAALLLHFDDLVRSAAVLRGNSAAVERALAKSASSAQERALAAEERAEALRRELEESRREQHRLQAQLMQACADLEEEQLRRRRCEAGARALQVRLHGLCADASELGVAPGDVLNSLETDAGVRHHQQQHHNLNNHQQHRQQAGDEHSSGDLLDPDDFDYDNTDEEAAANAANAAFYHRRHASPRPPSSTSTSGTPTVAAAAAAASSRPPPIPPTVPPLIVECVREIERRGMREVGLYRVSGSHKQVRQLWDAYAQRLQVPDLAGVEDVHVICGLLKMYLASLPEPLITHRLWPEFAHAAETGSADLACATLLSLPPASRDTLVFLLAHLLRVADSPAVQMTVPNLARTLAPSLVGNSCPDPEPLTTISETAIQQSILRLLLCLPSAYFADLLSSELAGCQGPQQQTPMPPQQLPLDANGQSYIASKTPLLRPRLELPPMGDLKDPKYKEKVNFLREKYRATRKIFFPHPK